jgi:hypothetical protein
VYNGLIQIVIGKDYLTSTSNGEQVKQPSNGNSINFNDWNFNLGFYKGCYPTLKNNPQTPKLCPE